MVGGDHIQNCDPRETSSCAATVTFHFSAMPSGRAALRPVVLPDPEGDEIPDGEQYEENADDEGVQQEAEGEDDAEEHDNPTAPGSGTGNDVDVEDAPGTPVTPDSKVKTATVGIEHVFAPRIPSDFLEPSDVPFDVEYDEDEDEDVEVNEGTAKELALQVQEYVKVEGHLIHVNQLAFDNDLTRGQARKLDPNVLAIHRKSVEQFGIIGMAQCCVVEEESMSLRVR